MLRGSAPVTVAQHRAVAALLLSFAACRGEADAVPPPTASALPAAAREAPAFGPATLPGIGAGAPQEMLAALIAAAPDGILRQGEALALAPAGAPPRVALLDAGAAPRSELAYAFAKGRQTLGLRLTMRVGLATPGAEAPEQPMPRVAMLLDLTTGERSASGDTPIEAVIRGVAVEPTSALEAQVASAMRPQLAALDGLHIEHLVTAKGYVHDTRARLPAGLSPGAQQALSGLSQSFESMIAPLPSEPVGVGARWQVAARIARAGSDLVQIATYTMKSREADRLALDVELAQLAATDAIAAPSGESARLRSFQSRGGGATRVDLAHAGPEGGELSLQSSAVVDALDDGAGGVMKIDLVTSVELYRLAK